MDIVAFADEHVDGAAAMLAERHAAQLAVEPLLPRRTDFAAQVENEREDATGAVAIEDGEVVGYLLGKRREDFLGTHVWSHVAGHAVRAARGSGAGVALTAVALRWGYENGYETMITDWRMSNLLASRFWPRRGFRETFLRLYRSIP